MFARWIVVLLPIRGCQNGGAGVTYDVPDGRRCLHRYFGTSAAFGWPKVRSRTRTRRGLALRLMQRLYFGSTWPTILGGKPSTIREALTCR